MATNFTATTITAAVDENDLVLAVTSATGFTVGYFAQMGNEMVSIRAISSTNITVTRGVNGTKAEPHGAKTTIVVAAPQYWNMPKAAAMYYNGGHATNFSSQNVFPTLYPATIATATAYTVSVGELMGGFLLDDPSGGAQTLTLPTAALLVAGWPGCTLGSTMRVIVRNTADANETITVAAGTGGTVTGGGTMTIAQNNQKEFLIRITGEKVGGEAYIVYSLGTVTF